jgi:CheY-like chemotaxis protein
MKPRVLVVEDETDIRDLIVYTLTNRGYDAVGVECGEEAWIEAARQVPALLVLDVLLPDMDGLSLCEMFRRIPNTAKTPILMLTACATLQTRTIAGSCGPPFARAGFRRGLEAALFGFGRNFFCSRCNVASAFLNSRRAIFRSRKAWRAFRRVRLYNRRASLKFLLACASDSSSRSTTCSAALQPLSVASNASCAFTRAAFSGRTFIAGEPPREKWQLPNVEVTTA